MQDGGGGFINFRSSQQPFVQGNPQQQKSETSQVKSSLLDDKMYGMLIDKGGLKNDVDNFAANLANLDDSIMDFIGAGNDIKARQMFAEINTLRINKEMWENALKQSQAQGGFGEVAVGDQGEMYVKDKNGRIGAISTTQYVKNKGAYNPLTVSDLLIARQYDPSLVNNQSVFAVAGTAIGMEKIVDHIKSLVNSIGTEKSTEEGFVTKSQLTGLTGDQLEKLKGAINSPTDVKVKVETLSERGHLNEAFNYIWKSLGRNAQLKLAAVAALNGDTDPTEIIKNALISGTDLQSSTTFDQIKSIDGEAIDGSTKGTTNITPYEALYLGMGTPSTFMWNDTTSKNKMALIATAKAKLITSDGKQIGTTTLNKIYNSDIGTLLETGDAFFGNKKIGAGDLDKIVYDGKDAARVYLPVDDSGKPNYQILRQIKEVDKEIQKHPDWTARQINDYYVARNLPFVKVNDDKQLITTEAMKPFLVFYGYSGENSQAVKGNSEIQMLDNNVDDEDPAKDTKEVAINTMEGVWKALKVEKPTGWDWLTDYYKGIVAIPFNKDATMYATGMVGNGPTHKTPSRVEYQINATARKITPLNIE